MYHNAQVTLRLPAATVEMIDTMRGSTPRGTYIRAIIDAHLYTPEELVEETTEDNGGGTSGRTPRRRPRSPDNPFVVVTENDRHLHHYKKGDILRYEKGAPIYTHECECGATKEE